MIDFVSVGDLLFEKVNFVSFGADMYIVLWIWSDFREF